MNTTAQMVVKNEERFIWFAIKSVLPYVAKFLITDTGSTDNTLKIIKSIKSKKINLVQDKKTSIVKIRQEQLRKTKASWFLLVDGDEIWPKDQLKKLLHLTKVLPKDKIAVVNETRNCAGDTWHYLPQSAGAYQFFGQKGHFNIRLMRTLPYKIVGSYPWEKYRLESKSINKLTNRLAFSDAWYLHVTHLKRSFWEKGVKGRRKKIIDKGILMRKKELPEVFFKKYPEIVPNPLVKRSLLYQLKASFVTPLKKLRRLIS